MRGQLGDLPRMGPVCGVGDALVTRDELPMVGIPSGPSWGYLLVKTGGVSMVGGCRVADAYRAALFPRSGSPYDKLGHRR